MEYIINKELLSSEKIAERVKSLGATITRDYCERNPILVCVLKGAIMFFSDIIREIKLDVKLEFLIVSSYGEATESSGRVRLVKDIDCSVENKDVIIIEDIIDSGNTLSYLKELFNLRKANSVKICTLLDKPSRRTTELVGDYVGFEIEDEFVVGYGLDINEKYRNLSDICVLAPK